MNLTHMKVANRLAIGFGLVACLLALLIFLGLSRMAQIKERMDEITMVNTVQSKLAAAMDSSIAERSLALRNMILLKDADELQIEVKRLAVQEKKYADAEQKLSAMFASLAGTAPEEKELIEKIRQSSIVGTPYFARAQALAVDKKPDEAYQLLRFEFRPIQKKWWDLLRELNALEETQNTQAMQDAEKAYASARVLMLVFGGLALLVSAIAAVAITRSVVGQLGCEPDEAAEIAAQIAAGNLTCTIEPKHNDCSSLLFAMRSMRDSLAAIVSQVHVSTETMATASGQIAAGNLDLSSRTEQQASSLEETASSMEELTSTVRQNADHASQANGLAQSASEVAGQGGAVVSQVVQTMASINASSNKIVDIIAVIDGIAFQTNILALNAAVEAARAGEQGRGFAVVASEVRSLAQRSAAAAKEIKTLIGDSVDKVAVGNRLVEQAGTTMTQLVSRVGQVTLIMGDIMSATNEQHSGIEQINLAITQMDEVTQQNAALVEEAAAAAEALQEQAAKLTELVSVFRLTGSQEQGGRTALPGRAPVALLAEFRSKAVAAPRPPSRLPRRLA
jgi:methyl-accepting chemotaxis protein